ncbi:trehalose-phosphatase [Massilia sp. DWR3-1-1]|uniref:trehalose-phosphatase n=1 Tax=Massilia sp. DWR3-1-1 TaxID=2804559 RepID=UPI003CECEA5A
MTATVPGQGPSVIDAAPLWRLGWLDHGLFLDFDGTLVELAERPEQVRVAAPLLDLLARLQVLLGGKLALISGRPVAQIDAMLFPLRLPVAGVHGLERRDADGRLHQAAIPDMRSVLAAAQALAVIHPDLWVEQKYGALALHYRQAPQLGPLCDSSMAEAVRHCPGTVLLKGKMVAEIKPAGVDKGTAIRAFLDEAPFAGHLALFVGDDLTDEAGFDMVQRAGGVGIKVGPGHSIAQCRIDSPGALFAALDQVASTLLRRIE